MDDGIAVGDDAQSVGDVRCFDRGTPVVVTTALGLLGHQVPQARSTRPPMLHFRV